MASVPQPLVMPTTYPVEVEIKFKFLVSNPEDYEYLLSPIKEESIASDATELFEAFDPPLICTEVNGIKII